MTNTPLVSICCLSFNHAPYLSECLEGFLRQETKFPIEILIHDDASTDGSDDIIRKYAEKYPDIIFPIYETINQYSNGHQGTIDIEFNYSRARGKYIAYCEGDDYWTDSLKLQKQVDFMENHPDYSVCFHRYSRLFTSTGKTYGDYAGKYFKEGQDGVDITMDIFFGSWITQPLTMMFRRSMFSADWQKHYKYYRDMHEIYHLLNVGKGYLFAFNGGVYRYHKGGIHSMITKSQYCEESLSMDREFFLKTHEEGAKRVYCTTLQDAIQTYGHTNKIKALRYAFVQFFLSGKYKRFWKNIRMIKNGHF